MTLYFAWRYFVLCLHLRHRHFVHHVADDEDEEDGGRIPTKRWNGGRKIPSVIRSRVGTSTLYVVVCGGICLLWPKRLEASSL